MFMYRFILFALTVLISCPQLTRAEGQPDPSLASALALQDAVQKAVERAEPSIACILVSRSDLYRRWFDNQPPKDQPGKLGGFDPRWIANAKIEPAQRDALVEAVRKKNPQHVQRFWFDEAFNRELRQRLDLSDPAYVPASYGSGVVVGADGLILTNYHVVRRATKLYARLPGGKGSYADVYAADPRSDLAVLRLVDRRVGPLKPLKRGDASAVRKGQFVVSLANPFAAGYPDGSPSVSFGVVSNIRRRAPTKRMLSDEDRRNLPLHHFSLLLQTDARLNLGCSGGALVNLKGEWIGLTTALAAVQGGDTPGGYALPLDRTMNRIIDVLVQGKEVEYGFLGINFQSLVDSGPGIRIHHVIGNSPAEAAGLGGDEVVLAVNDRPLQNTDELFLAIGAELAGTEVRLKVQDRSGQERTVPVTLTKYYEPQLGIVTNRRPFAHGVRVDYASVLFQRDVASRGGIAPGVYVEEVQPGSTAAKQRLTGMVITAVNGNAVHDPPDFYREVHAADEASSGVEVTVLSPTEDTGRSRLVKLD
jgi:S1-C subfamily serine protease